MTKLAITIGVNKYYDKKIPDLKYAASDSEKVRDFLLQEENFDEVFCYTDNSPPDKLPEYAKLIRFFDEEIESLRADDFWFFFAGHGRRGDDQIDYLLLYDSYLKDITKLSLSVNYVIQRLQLIGADKIIVTIDACRNNKDSQIGKETQQKIRKMAQVSIFSCSRYEYSREEPKIQQGVFTHTLLKAFRSGQVTPKKLDEYLPSEIAKLSKQTPIVNFGSTAQSNLILTPNYANEDDIENLRSDAFTASRKEKWYDGNLSFKNLKNVKNFKNLELDQEEREEYKKVRDKVSEKQRSSNKTRSLTDFPESNNIGKTIEMLIIFLVFSLLAMPLMENILSVIFRDEPEIRRKI